MNEISLISLGLLVVLFLFNLWELLFLKKGEGKTGLDKWKLGLFIIALSSLLFFIYFTSSMSTIGFKQTIVTADETFTYQSNEYAENFAYLPLAVAIYSCQWLMLFIQIIQGYNFFGRERLGRMND